MFEEEKIMRIKGVINIITSNELSFSCLYSKGERYLYEFPVF